LFSGAAADRGEAAEWPAAIDSAVHDSIFR